MYPYLNPLCSYLLMKLELTVEIHYASTAIAYIRGKPIRSQKLIFRGERLSTLGAMSTSGVLDCKVVRGKVDADVSYDFIHTSLLPKLMPFNGINPNSVVILDNCAIHQVEEITAAIDNVGAFVLYLPPY